LVGANQRKRRVDGEFYRGKHTGGGGKIRKGTESGDGGIGKTFPVPIRGGVPGAGVKKKGKKGEKSETHLRMGGLRKKETSSLS